MQCFGKFPIATKSMDDKVGVSKFSVEDFGLKVPKKFVGEPVSVSLFSGIEQV